MNATTPALAQFGAGLLIKRLDLAMRLIARAKIDDRLSEAERTAVYQLEGHGLVYVGLLSDLRARRIDGADTAIAKLVVIAEEYCTLVHGAFAVSAVGRIAQ